MVSIHQDGTPPFQIGLFNQCPSNIPGTLLNPKLDTRISVCPSVFHQSVTLRLPPWILKMGGLESSGWRKISSNGKTKRIAKKNCRFCRFIWYFLLILDIFGLFLKLLMILQNVTKFTTEQNEPKQKNGPFFGQRAKKASARSPP